jgi:hypothetical protein
MLHSEDRLRFVAMLGVAFLAAAAQAASPISQVLSCGKVGTVGGLGAGTDLVRFTIDTKRYPEAVCNDGSPAVFYYGRYTNEADRNKWVIMMQGGGSCTSGQNCAERWCSVNTNYGMDKMTSTLTKAGIRGNGILDPGAHNQFGTWNRVLLFYCSSDLWSGTSSSTQHAVSGASGVDYVIYYKGARIVDAVIETLRRQARGRAAAPPSTTPHALPDLDGATHVIFSGSSAGGIGTIYNADRIGAKLKAANPALVFKALIDAGFPPLSETRDYSHTTACLSNPQACNYSNVQQFSYATVDQGLYGARTDESCLSWHAAHQPGTEWKCGDSTHVVVNHVSTPMFIHMDEQDESIGGSFVEDGYGTSADFGRGVEQGLRDLATLNTTAEEGSVRNGGAPLATPGAYGPQCTDHESLKEDTAFFEVKISGLSYHDVVWNWWTGAQPPVAIRTFTPPGGPVVGCPPD